MVWGLYPAVFMADIWLLVRLDCTLELVLAVFGEPYIKLRLATCRASALPAILSPGL